MVSQIQVSFYPSPSVGHNNVNHNGAGDRVFVNSTGETAFRSGKMDVYRAMPRWHESDTSTRGLVYDNAQMPRWHEYETSTRGLEYDNATVVFTPKPSVG